MTRTGRLRQLLAVAGAVALMASVAAVPAGAAERDLATDTNQDATASAVRAYQAVYPQMSVDAAKLAATQQEVRKELHRRLARDPGTYGGGYFDPPSGVSHVTLTNEAAASAASRYGRQLGLNVEAHVVKYSFAELWKRAESLRAGTDELGKVAKGQVGVEVASNSVTVALSKKDEASLSPGAVPAWVKIVPAATVRTEEDVCTARDNCNDSLRAGLVITRNGVGCSLGFMARSTVRWALTAGHCSDPAAATTWSTAGTQIGTLNTVNAINAGAVDAAAIQVTNAGYAADTIGRIYIGANLWEGVKGWADTLSFIWVGDVVCVSARYQAPATFGNPCGMVTNTSDPTNRGLVRYEGYDPCPGDSGGGVYWLPPSGRRHAFGLHSRSLTGCNVAANPVAWFSALPQFWTGLTYELG